MPDPNIQFLKRDEDEIKKYDGHLKPMRTSLAQGEAIPIKQLSFSNVPLLKEYA